MGLMTSLLIGGALAGGFLLGRKGKKEDGQPPDPNQVAMPEETAADQLASTNPPSAPADESANVAAAGETAARTRRRARAGNSGRVTTGASGTPGVTAGGSPRSLVGY